MNFISGALRGALNTSVQVLNQPVVKEGVKNFAGTVTCAFGLVELYDIYQIVRGKKISSEDFSQSSENVELLQKAIILSAKVSLVLSAGVSRPGVFIISSLAGAIFSAPQLERVFGPNTTFVANWGHPRHLVSLAAVILALPSVAKSTIEGINWAYRKIQEIQNSSKPVKSKKSGLIDKPKIEKSKLKKWSSDLYVRMMALFNTITSRPTLHLGNQFARYLLQRV